LDPYFYNKSLGFVKNDKIKRATFIIEGDVWIGHNSTIIPLVSRVGRGSVMAAGAVVTTDVPK